MTQGWVYVENAATGGAAWLPDNPGVIAHHRGRGWEVAEPPAEPEPEPLAASADDEPEINGPQPAAVEDVQEASDLPATDDDEGRGVTTSG